MARIDNLTNFLTDVASAIKEKREMESTDLIAAEDFDTEIRAIETGTDTEDANATSNDVLSPKVFYNAEGRQVGGIGVEREPGSLSKYDITIESGLTIIDICKELNLAIGKRTESISGTNTTVYYLCRIVNDVISVENGNQLSTYAGFDMKFCKDGNDLYVFGVYSGGMAKYLVDIENLTITQITSITISGRSIPSDGESHRR